MKKVAALLFCIFVSFASYAEIYSVENVKEVKNMTKDIFEKRNPEKTLFIFPLENFIVRPTHPAMQIQEQSYSSLLTKAFSKANSSVASYASVLMLLEYPNELVDEELPDLIDYIQKNNSAVIVTTPNVTGGINKIDFLDVWTLNYLKSKNIDLAQGVFANKQFIFDKEMKKINGTYPTFYKGLLSYNSDNTDNSSLQVLSAFLVLKLNKIPDVVVAVSPSRQYLEELDKQLKVFREDNEFFGIVYNPPVLKTKYISPKDYLQFWQDFVKKLNQIKRKGVDLKLENPYDE